MIRNNRGVRWHFLAVLKIQSWLPMWFFLGSFSWHLQNSSRSTSVWFTIIVSFLRDILGSCYPFRLELIISLIRTIVCKEYRLIKTLHNCIVRNATLQWTFSSAICLGIVTCKLLLVGYLIIHFQNWTKKSVLPQYCESRLTGVSYDFIFLQQWVVKPGICGLDLFIWVPVNFVAGD